MIALLSFSFSILYFLTYSISIPSFFCKLNLLIDFQTHFLKRIDTSALNYFLFNFTFNYAHIHQLHTWRNILWINWYFRVHVWVEINWIEAIDKCSIGRYFNNFINFVLPVWNNYSINWIHWNYSYSNNLRDNVSYFIF